MHCHTATSVYLPGSNSSCRSEQSLSRFQLAASSLFDFYVPFMFHKKNQRSIVQLGHFLQDDVGLLLDGLSGKVEKPEDLLVEPVVVRSQVLMPQHFPNFNPLSLDVVGVDVHLHAINDVKSRELLRVVDLWMEVVLFELLRIASPFVAYQDYARLDPVPDERDENGSGPFSVAINADRRPPFGSRSRSPTTQRSSAAGGWPRWYFALNILHSSTSTTFTGPPSLWSPFAFSHGVPNQK